MVYHHSPSFSFPFSPSFPFPFSHSFPFSHFFSFSWPRSAQKAEVGASVSSQAGLHPPPRVGWSLLNNYSISILIYVAERVYLKEFGTLTGCDAGLYSMLAVAMLMTHRSQGSLSSR